MIRSMALIKGSMVRHYARNGKMKHCCMQHNLQLLILNILHFLGQMFNFRMTFIYNESNEKIVLYFIPLDVKGCIYHFTKVADTPFHIQGDNLYFVCFIQRH